MPSDEIFPKILTALFIYPNCHKPLLWLVEEQRINKLTTIETVEQGLNILVHGNLETIIHVHVVVNVWIHVLLKLYSRSQHKTSVLREKGDVSKHTILKSGFRDWGVCGKTLKKKVKVFLSNLSLKSDVLIFQDAYSQQIYSHLALLFSVKTYSVTRTDWHNVGYDGIWS